MLDQQRERLKAIRTFPSLVKYLRDDLDWPIETEDFDEIVFDYEPEELGIDPRSAVKIEEIKQLRPLATDQPWGIFFIKFEPKRLPVVVLRRVLSRLALRKRASANRPEQASWNLDDLLFISNYGEGEQRQITFAHFSQDRATGGLPTLKVLGWDDADTALHLDYCHQELKEKLRWPEGQPDIAEWRERWSSAFTLRHREVITTSKELATRLADLARRIRRRASAVLVLETEQGHLRKLYKSFQEALVHDLSEDDFADMYAQTIAYGLLTAQVSPAMALTQHSAGQSVFIANPFLRDMLDAFLTAGGRKGGIDFDELGVKEVVELLKSPDTHMAAILRDFGNRTQQDDPVIYFYELFLSEYDKKKKAQRGVFYTPRPVVSYIVRSVHELLQSEFGLEDGLADTATWREVSERKPGITVPVGLSPDEPFVQILDPATGTATFLVEVIDIVHQTMRAKWISQGHMALDTQGLWNEYVPKHLLPRLYGFELMMAPFAVAHMKVGLKLYETGYIFKGDERVRVHLANSLEPAADSVPNRVFQQWAPALAHEAVSVNELKQAGRFTVVIGNPPYSGHSANSAPWARQLVESYKKDCPELYKPAQAKWLQDDYVKFLALGQWHVQSTGHGILGVITSHAYLDNPTFRGMRRSLMSTFNHVYILNLHGNAKKQEVAPDGSKDENVFDIQQGVAVGLLIRESGDCGPATVHYADLWGLRRTKYVTLFDTEMSSTEWAELNPKERFYLFLPQDTSLLAEYEQLWRLPDIMDRNGDPAPGIVTTHDEFAVSWSAEEARTKVRRLIETGSEDEARQLFRLCSQAQWSYERAKRELADAEWENDIEPILYRPFDIRFTVYDSNVAVHRRDRVMRHMRAGANLALCTNRQVKGDFHHAIVTRRIVGYNLFETAHAAPFVFPLYLYPSNRQIQFGEAKPFPNLNPEFITTVSGNLGLALSEAERGDLVNTLGPEDILGYAYAILHSPTYRTRYAGFLKIDFPRLPLSSDRELFKALAAKGGELVSLHLMEAPVLDAFITRYPISGTNAVDKVTYDESARRVRINNTQFFEGVPPEVWDFHIGGYQVAHKWLKDRRGRTLTYDELTHYQKVIVALKETIRVMSDIDEVIGDHGGWPLGST